VKKEHREPNVLFFKDLAGLPYEKYLQKLLPAIAEGGEGETTHLEMDYARQIIVNAELTLLKIRSSGRRLSSALLLLLSHALLD